jgi:hypothetical protein
MRKRICLEANAPARGPSWPVRTGYDLTEQIPPQSSAFCEHWPLAGGVCGSSTPYRLSPKRLKGPASWLAWFAARSTTPIKRGLDLQSGEAPAAAEAQAC